MMRHYISLGIIAICFLFHPGEVYATPTTFIWTPSADIQPYGKIHFGSDFYFPQRSHDGLDTPLHLQQVYGLTFSILSNKQDENILGKIWSPLGLILAETGFDYKRGYGSSADSHPWYFHWKIGVPENSYSAYMPALGFGIYDKGFKKGLTDYTIGYVRASKSLSLSGIQLGRFTVGYFQGNDDLLIGKNGEIDSNGIMLAWERKIPEISNKLWVCLDYQGSESSYGTFNYGFAWTFNEGFSMILGIDKFNNSDIPDDITVQLDFDF